jgi:hypothetical protein
MEFSIPFSNLSKPSNKTECHDPLFAAQLHLQDFAQRVVIWGLLKRDQHAMGIT